jgi:6-phosphofructokinase 1
MYKDTYVYNTGSITIVEIMGRHAGWLAGSAALAGLAGAAPDFIYLPEIPFDLDRNLSDIHNTYKEKGKCLLCVSEGIRYTDGTYVAEAKVSPTDGFAHPQLGGLAATLSGIIKMSTGAKVRGVELNLLQRCGAHLASQTDIDEAFLAGSEAVKQAVAGETGKMVALIREEDNGAYVCRTKLVPVEQVANVEKKVPAEWINAAGNGVTSEFIDYALPLIQGESRRALEFGLPRFAKLKKERVSI